MNSKKSLFGVALSVLLLLIAWPPNSFVYLLFIAYSPVLLICFSQKKLAHSFLYFYLFYFTFLGIENYELLKEGYNLKASISGLFLIPLFWSTPILLGVYMKRVIGLNKALIVYSIVYILQEWVQMKWDLSFIWFHNGFAFGQSSWSTILYPLIGQLGVGFMVIGINCLVVWAFLKRKDRNKVSIAIIAIILIIVSPFLFNSNSKNHKPKSKLRVAVFSPTTNENLIVKDDLRAQINLFISHLRKSNINTIDLVIGPEGYLNDVSGNPLFVDQLDSLGPIKELKLISKEINAPILIGAILIDLINSKEYPSTTAKKRKKDEYFEIYNGSLLINYRNKTEWRTKNQLIPIAEFIPFNKILNSHWSPIQRIDNGYGTIDNQGNYIINGYSVASSICYESLFNTNLAENTDFHIVLSNDWTKNKSTLSQNLVYLSSVVKSTKTPIVFGSMNNESVYIDRSTALVHPKPNTLGILDIEF